MCLKFRTFWKKDEYPTLIISQIIASERSGYLYVEKVLLQNAIRLSTYWQFPNTAEIRTAPLLWCFSMNSRYIELEELCLILIWYLQTVP